MSCGNSFGDFFRVTTFGESHGPAVGCVLDGCPAGLPFDTAMLQRELDKRRPGGGGASTTRSEADSGEILSGVFEGKTLGTPIAILIRNTAQNSGDYDSLRGIYRPGHADYCWDAKFGIRDHRGGGRASGRETAARVAAGAVAKTLLSHFGIKILAWTAAVGGIKSPDFDGAGFDIDEIERNLLRIPNAEVAGSAATFIEQLKESGDSIGGKIACRAEGVPAGLGEPVFGKLDAKIAQAMLSIGAVKGVEFGRGFFAAELYGSQNNDIPIIGKTNHAGGILGGISNGKALEFKAVFKAVPSIALEQKTVDKDKNEVRLKIKGRHDICICPRAVPVVEAMCALVIADALLAQRCARL